MNAEKLISHTLGLTKTAEHALKILTCLCLSSGRPVPASAVARCARIPERQAARLLQLLTWRGVTRSRRGPSGGYQLRRSPEGMRVAEVIELFQAVPDPDSELLDDPLQRVWSETAGRCLADWEQLTIAELARRTADQWECPSPKLSTHESKENGSAAVEVQRRPEEEEMGKKKVAGFLACFIVLLLTGMTANAGEIVGTLGVPKPDQAVVYVEKVPGTFPGGHAKMGQKNKVFQPYVLPVVRGTTVEFLNGDDLQHNVFGVGADEFNLGTFGKGAAREHTFNKEGQVALLCNVHPEMEAYILVLDNPYFAQTDASGKFRIANVPPGTYVIKAWYNGKTRKQTVTVPATGAVTATF